MKKRLALLLAVSMAAASFTAIPTFAAQQQVINFNDGNAAFTGANDITTEFVDISEGDKAVKFTSTSSELTNSGSRAFRYNLPANVAEETSVFSFDFMVESMVSGNAQGYAIDLAYNAGGWKHAPQVMADGTFGSASWQVGKWYTVKYYLDVDRKTIAAGLVDKETGAETEAFAPQAVSIGDSKGLNNLELHPLINGVMYMDNLAWAAERTRVVITSPTVGAAINFDNPIEVTASIPAGAEKAVLKLNGETEKELTDIAESEKISFGEVSSPVYGELTVEVEATYSDKTLSAANTYNVGAFEKKNIFKGTPYIDPKNTNKEGWYSGRVDGDGTTARIDPAIEKNTDKYEWSGEKASWFKIGAVADNDIALRIPNITITKSLANSTVDWSFKLEFENPNGVGKISLDTKDGSGKWVSFKSLITNGVFADGTAAEAGKTYSVNVRFDTIKKTIAVSLDGNVIINANGADNFTFACIEAKIANGSSIKISDMAMDFITPVNDIIGLSGTIGGAESSEVEWKNGELKPAADSVSMKFVSAVTSTGASAAALYKLENGEMTWVDAEATIEGDKVTVTPAEGFEPLCDYVLYMNELTVGSRTYGAPIVKSFKTGSAEFDVTAPADGQKFLDKDIAIRVISPDVAPTITVDGWEYEATDLGKDVYEVVVPVSNINLGMHDIKIVSGENVRELEVETYSFIGPVNGANGVTGNDWFMTLSKAGQVSRCAGTDATQTNGISLDASNGGSYICVYTSVAKVPTGDSLTVAFDIKRETSNASFDLEAEAAGWRWIGGNPLIKPDGTINGTDKVLPVGEWHNIRVTQEITDNGKCSVWLDGELIKDAASGTNFAGLSQMKYQALTGKIALDNLFFNDTVNYVLSPRLSGVSYNTGKAETASEDNYTISAASKTITLALTEEFNTISTDDVYIIDEDGNEVLVAEVAKDANKVIITPEEALPADKAITVTLSGDLDVLSGENKYGMGADLDIKLFAADDSDKLGEFYITKTAEGTAAAHIDLIKGKQTTLPANAELYIAAYENGTLVDAAVSSAALTEGANSIDTKAITVSDTTKLKAFFWEAGTMTPIAMTEIVK